MARFLGVPRQVGTGGLVRSQVKVIGVREALIKLGLVNKIARLELGYLTAASAKGMFELAQFYCPVITGNLQSGIKIAKLGSYTWQITASSRDGFSAAKNGKEYAGFVEYGTSRMGPRFYMRRAYQETSPLAAAGLQVIAARLEAL